MKLFLLLSLIAVGCASAEEKVTLCGRQLAIARVLMCYGPEYVMKRGNGSPLLDNMVRADEFNWPWAGKRGALSADWSRYKRAELGLVDICCLRPCSKEILLDYC